MKKIFGLTLLLILALTLAGCGSNSQSLTGTTWQWIAMQETVPASQSVVPDPQNYTIKFNDDGTAEIKADCNGVGATYTTNGSNITITLGAGTLMYCGDASQDTIYKESLSKVDSYSIDGSGLHLNFPNDGGKMDFKAAK